MSIEFRYEKKFLLEPQSGICPEYYILTNSAFFRKAYPDRQVNSIYFDDNTNTSYLDSINGEKQRTKIRLRWYGNIKSVIDKPILEFKIKKGDTNTKVQYTLSPIQLNQISTHLILNSILPCNKTQQTYLEYFSQMSPLYLSSYLRKYYQSELKKIRLTLDTNLSWQSLPHTNPIHYMTPKKLVGYSVIELKYPVNSHKYAMQFTTEFPFRLSKISKFFVGRSIQLNQFASCET